MCLLTPLQRCPTGELGRLSGVTADTLGRDVGGARVDAWMKFTVLLYFRCPLLRPQDEWRFPESRHDLDDRNGAESCQKPEPRFACFLALKRGRSLQSPGENGCFGEGCQELELLAISQPTHEIPPYRGPVQEKVSCQEKFCWDAGGEKGITGFATGSA